MKANHRSVLKNIYDLLKGPIGRYENSIIKKLVKNGTKARTRVIFDSISYYIPKQEVAKELEDLGYVIRHHRKYHEYSITATGIWQYEKYLGIADTSDLLSIIHDEYFKHVKKALVDLDKIILASLLFSRIFSSKNQIETGKEATQPKHNNHWYDITVAAMNILYEVKSITKTDHKFVGHPNKTYLYVRQNDLQEQSNGIYVRGTDGTHYLDLGKEEGQLDEKKLNSIFGFIFGEELDLSCFDIIIKQLQSFARKNRYKLNDNKLFLNSNTTRILTNTFETKYLSYETI